MGDYDCCEPTMPSTNYGNKCCGSVEMREPTTKEFTLVKGFEKVRIVNIKQRNIDGEIVKDVDFLEVATVLKSTLGDEAIIWQSAYVPDEVLDLLTKVKL